MADQPRGSRVPKRLARPNGAGFVTKFEVDAYYLSRFTVQKVGAAIHTEYWIPAEDLPEFNQNIVGKIAVTAEFR